MATPRYGNRIHASQHNSAVASGYACDFLHVTGAQENLSDIPTGSVVTLMSINAAPGTGSVAIVCGSDIVMEATIARDYKMGFYAYAPISVNIPDSTADVTVYFAPPAKGSTVN